jgi:hypothetical protein
MQRNFLRVILIVFLKKKAMIGRRKDWGRFVLLSIIQIFPNPTLVAIITFPLGIMLVELFNTALHQAKTNAEQNLKNAKELFESYLNRIFEEKGDDWEEKRLGEVCNIIGGGTPSKKNDEFYIAVAPVPSLMISLEIFLNHLKRNPTDNCFEALGIMPFKS